MSAADDNRVTGDPSIFVFLSRMVGRRYASVDGSFSGRLSDMTATVSERFPEIETVIFATRSGLREVPADPGLLRAVACGGPLPPGPGPTPVQDSGRLHLRRDLMDRQVVDIKGAKVVRVNDIHLLFHGGKCFLVHVDIGMTGLARRLGMERWMRNLARLLRREPGDELVSWKFVQPLSGPGNSPVQLTLRQEQLKRMHPGELADIIEELDPGERLALVRSIDTEQAADILEEAEETVQAAILRDLDTALAADILEEMEPAAAVDLVEMLPEEDQQTIMAQMEAGEREQLERLSGAEEDTAASVMTVEYLSCGASGTVADAMSVLRERVEDVSFFGYVYCLGDEDRLAGVISLRQIIRSDPAARLSDLMNRRITVLREDDDLDDVAEMFMKFRLHALPVVDREGRISGIVAFEHAFDELLPRFAKLAG